MKERDWSRYNGHSEAMLQHLRGASVSRTKVGRRKLRLVACGCSRLMWKHLEPEWRAVVELAEGFADGAGTTAELGKAFKSLAKFSTGDYSPDTPGANRCTAAALVQACASTSPLSAAFHITCIPVILDPVTHQTRRDSFPPSEEALCDLFRDVFGNPFRPAAFDKAWRTDTVLSLARVMYETRDFAAMPILADALQEAGCENEEVLAHCRDPKGVHVRGCWVVDLVLGKG
jgi:hypothetical protein